ncbi:nucleoside-diphosphate-sugar epimerase [Flavobacterium limnosediminis JC2902]|uniref:Nucleoside-diphosphate-sugar epimerase n=1 Tax=Flavobacterium limnosediminis JC2902 TaxID=1341181 RepID=V6SS88_9FLAO|nr:SDR family oxidoreductase [Flavobacterium limnosediminis]ESU27285.1 nucleoside-diphosphate-sugar epimerase [Flavobacterium limnosediminis JC2902]
MKILLTGANGYVGRRLLPELLAQGHEVTCAVRDKMRLGLDSETLSKISIWEVDFLSEPDFTTLPKNIDVAYYLIHSMSSSTENFDKMETVAADHFNAYMNEIKVKQVVYLSGIVNNKVLSKHLSSRRNVEKILYGGNFNLTVLRAGIIVGSGSASFEIIRDLCEKLPVMITPKWVLTRTQPIAIRDVIKYLIGVQLREDCYNQSFDIGGPEVLTYKEMLQLYAKTRGFKNRIITVPVMTPKLSSYWLYFVTSTSYKLAMNLVDSMKIEVISKDNRLEQMLNMKPISYTDAIKLAFKKIEQNLVISSWKDSLVSGRFKHNLSEFVQVPTFGCLSDHQKIKVGNPENALKNIWSIGGKKGWYYGSWMWQIRGFLDKLFGGVGLRRGRTNPNQLNSGAALDFWRVLLADKNKKRLLLFAEMRLPGEAWLEFKIDDNNILHQTATFRPKGLWGRLYWYAMLPFHYFIFGGMLKNIAGNKA